MSAVVPTPAARSARVQHILWGLVALVIGLLLLAGSWLLYGTYQDARRTALQRIERTTQSLEGAINRSMSALDLLLGSVDDWLSLLPQPVAARDPESVRQMLEAVAQQNPLVSAVLLMDVQGRVLARADDLGVAQGDPVPTEWLQQALSGGKNVDSLLIQASATPGSAARILYVARLLRANTTGEHFFVVAQVPVISWLDWGVQGISLQGLEFTVEHVDGTRILSVPPVSVQSTHLPEPLRAQSAEVRVRQELSRLSGQPALLMAVPLVYEHQWLTVAMPMGMVLASWKPMAWTVGMGMLFFSVLLVLGASLGQAYLRHMDKAQQLVLESHTLLEKAMGSLAAGFILLDADGRILRWNQRYEQLFPWQASTLQAGSVLLDVLRRLELEFGEGLAPEIQALRQLLMQAVDEQQPPTEVRTQQRQFLQLRQRHTTEQGRVITCEDVTRIRDASAEIEALAFYDVLTGLPNRRMLMDQLQKALQHCRDNGTHGALMFVDMDKFKVLNDTMGHEMGDSLLKAVGRRLLAVVRHSDTVARLGGDEFVIMLTGLTGDAREAMATTERVGAKVLDSLQSPYMFGSYVHRTSASIGATLFDGSALQAAEVLKQADIAMYQIKTRRGGSLCFFEAAMQDALNERVLLERDLRRALMLDQMQLYFQPQFRANGEIVGMEALLRWNHPSLGMVPPYKFIRVAEESELILSIGSWVLESACAQLAKWQDVPLLAGIHVAVNVSARQFRQTDFVGQVLQSIARHGIAPALLKLELTESLVIDNMEDSIAKMHALRAAGVRCSMDDFGTGQSSLAYLTQLPLRQLKIDQSFVRNLGHKRSDAVIVQTIVGMGHSLRMNIIAEGVETVEQMTVLTRLGCHVFQGYVFSQPLPAAELEQFVAGPRPQWPQVAEIVPPALTAASARVRG